MARTGETIDSNLSWVEIFGQAGHRLSAVLTPHGIVLSLGMVYKPCGKTCLVAAYKSHLGLSK